MGLSRLSNLLKSSRGTILYVNPNDVDATDSIENQGNALTRPFKTIQRALIEAARFSYQRGLDNDRFGKTTIVVYPGDHIVDNRPGFIPDGANNYRLRNGSVSNDLPPFDLSSNFDLTTFNNELYKLNSIYGGVIIPRGTWHRSTSGEKGSIVINQAIRDDLFDPDSEFIPVSAANCVQLYDILIDEKPVIHTLGE